MQWIPETLKHLSVSKVFASALFFSASVIIFGPHIWSSQIPELKAELKVVSIAAFVFSGTYISAWALGAVFSCLALVKKDVTYWWRSKELSGLDRVFIELVAKQPGQVVNLNILDYSHGEISQLEMIQHGKTLAGRGLLVVSPYDDSIFSLTERGKAVGAIILAENRARNA